MTTTPETNDNYYESCITRLEVTIENIDKTLNRMENKFDDKFSEMDKKIDKLDLKMDKIETISASRMEKLDNRLWQIIFLLLSSSIIGLVLGKIFPWI